MKKKLTLKSGLTVLLGMASLVASGGTAPSQDWLKPANGATAFSDGTITAAPKGSVSTVAPQTKIPAKVKRDASGMTWTVLVDEDFSKLTEGSIQEPSEERLCYYYGAPGVDIDPEYTQQPGWTGSNAFSAGGAILMKEVNNTTGAPLNTPLGDYSGNLTITFRYRIAPGCEKHSQVIVDILKGGIEHPQIADCDFNFYACNVYPGQNDWKLAEITCQNKSADNDGFIQFNVYGEVIIDDILVTSKNDYIAPPVLKPITNFTATSFTANWEPVRLASFYYVELNKKVYTSDEDSMVFSEDFEDFTSVPAGWEINNFSSDRIADQGENDSRGLIMNNGDYIVTPDLLAKYKWFKMFGRLVLPDDFDIYSITGTVTFSLRTENGWQKLSSAPAGWFYDPWPIDFGGELFPGFNNNYYGLKIEVDGLADDTYLVFDSFEFETGRPSKLETVISFDNYVAVRDGQTSYTFDNLEPETEYYYGIKSFYQGIYSEAVSEHAFGVATPTVENATEISANSYTANWQKAPKATSYVATNYGVFEADEDITENIVLEEDFSKITDKVTWGFNLGDAEPMENYTPTSLDEYTTLPGWTGKGNLLYPGALGVEDSLSDLFYIQTPPMSLNNDDKFVLGLIGQILYDDEIVVWVNEQAYKLNAPAGEFGGEFDIPEHGDNMRIMFYTTNGAPFSLNYVCVSQNIKKGQKVFTYLSETTTDAETTSCSFIDLTDDYTLYAYNVKSVFEFEGATTYSTPSDKIFVNLKEGTSPSGITSIDTIVSIDEEAVWFTIDGRRISSPEKGICIAKFPDGTAKKVMVK